MYESYEWVVSISKAGKDPSASAKRVAIEENCVASAGSGLVRSGKAANAGRNLCGNWISVSQSEMLIARLETVRPRMVEISRR